MSATHETLLVEARGSAAGVLGPGAVLVALARGAGLQAEEIGALTPLGRGRVAVEIALQRALALATPRALPVLGEAGAATLVLRREDDPEDEAPRALLLTWDDGEPPAPGAVAAALAERSGGRVGPEEIGAGFGGPGWLRLTVPEALAAALRAEDALAVGGRSLAVLLGDGGKKKP